VRSWADHDAVYGSFDRASVLASYDWDAPEELDIAHEACDRQAGASDRVSTPLPKVPRRSSRSSPVTARLLRCLSPHEASGRSMSTSNQSVTTGGTGEFEHPVAHPFSRGLFAAVLALGALGIVAYLPFATAVGLPLELFAVFGVLLVVGAYVGARYARRLDLHAPLVESFLEGTLTPRGAVSYLAPMAALGALVAALNLVYQYVVIRPLSLAASGTDTFVPSGAPFLVELTGPSLYGGLTEEVIFRFGLLTGVAVVLTALARRTDRTPSRALVVWSAIAIASVPFALEHLIFHPVLTPGLAGAVLASTGILGVLFGALYWKRGLESAMAVHLFANATYMVLFSLLV
jgi:hypothetical protein